MLNFLNVFLTSENNETKISSLSDEWKENYTLNDLNQHIKDIHSIKKNYIRSKKRKRKNGNCEDKCVQKKKFFLPII